MGASGPNVFTISFRYCMSVLFIALSSGAVMIYAVRKIIVPMIRVIQLVWFSWEMIAYVINAVIADANRILADEPQSMVALNCFFIHQRANSVLGIPAVT